MDLGGGVPETALWTLWHRAPNDPRAAALVERIDFPFAERFGRRHGLFVQWQWQRVRRFDEEIRRFAAACPGGTVVALGEGLETQFWRVDDGRLRWVGVDVDVMVAARRVLLEPDDARRRSVAASAFDVDV